jgi:hypothetical protein
MARANPKKWEQAKKDAKARMGGKHSARAMQLAAKLYKDRGGKYTGGKDSGQKSMTKWSKQKWRTKSGKPSVTGPKATGERYLPTKAINRMSDSRYKASSAKKKEDTAKGKQYSSQPKKRKKTA